MGENQQQQQIEYITKEINGKVIRFRECARCNKFTIPDNSFWDTCPKCMGKDPEYYYRKY